ncbi:hypothetical protein EPO05_01795, partial [Patescibacteria group bacterium]
MATEKENCMPKKYFLRLPFFIFLLTFITFSPAKAVNQSINYQGLLANSSGNPVSDGPHTLTFRIY